MKQLLTLFVFSLSAIVFGQKTPEKCNDLPYVKVDKKVVLTSNTQKQLKKTVPSDMKKGEYTASVKCYVSCQGMLDDFSYHKGDFSEDQQAWLLDVINDTEWTAAVKDDIYVTSTAFIQVVIKNGKVEVTLF